MTVTITTLGQITDDDGQVLFDPWHDRIAPRVQFTDWREAPCPGLEAWWASIESEVAEKLRAWVEDPPEPTPPDDALGELCVIIPLARGVREDRGFDLVGMLMPRIEDGALRAIRCHHGDHTRCTSPGDCSRREV